MDHVDATDPTAALLRTDAMTLVHLRAMTSCAAGAVGHPGLGPLEAAVRWLEGPARAQRRILEDQVFPALVESMAGSDPVCLRDLTTGLTQEREKLDRRWGGTIRPGLAAGTLAGPDLLAWATDFERHLQRTDEELLPMVPRLLDDEALDSLDQACKELPQADFHP